MRRSGFLQDVPINSSDIDQSLLNIESKARSNLFAWNGQFSPQFVEALLSRYAASGAQVLDPFAGSGTVLGEAARRELRAFGTEINPSAYIIGRTYELANLRRADRADIVRRLDDLLVSGLPFMESDSDTVARYLVDLHDAIDELDVRHLLETLITLADFSKAPTLGRIFAVWAKLKDAVMELAFSPQPIRMSNCDARHLPLGDDSIDLVVTSPPYINVFNYHQQYRGSVEALGWRPLDAAKSEIGSNRKHRGNRFLTVIQYCLDISETLAELSRVCRSTSRVIFVVGRRSSVRGVSFMNGELVAAIGVSATGMNLVTRQERVFTNRYGMRIYEDILHFTEPTQKSPASQQEAREIAKKALEVALDEATGDVALDIEEALRSAPTVHPSPTYRADMTTADGGTIGELPDATLREVVGR